MTVHAKYKFASLRIKKNSRSWSDIYRAQVDWLLAGNLPCIPLSFAHNPLTSKNKISSWTSPCYWLKANWNLTTKINSIKCFNLIRKGNHRKLSRSTENLYTVSSMLTPEACKSFFFCLMQILNSTTEFFLIKGFLTFLISNNSDIYNLSTWQSITDGQKQTDGWTQGNSKMFTIEHNKQLPQVDDHHQISSVAPCLS